MTLRGALGGKVRDVFEQLENLLDSDDAVSVLFDERRMVSYTQGLAASPCQLELVGVDVERSVRNVVGVQQLSTGIQRKERSCFTEELQSKIVTALPS